MPRKRRRESGDSQRKATKRQKVILHLEDSTAYDALIRKWSNKTRNTWQRHIIMMMCNTFRAPYTQSITQFNRFHALCGRIMSLESYANGTVKQLEAFMRGDTNFMSQPCSIPLPELPQSLQLDTRTVMCLDGTISDDMGLTTRDRVLTTDNRDRVSFCDRMWIVNDAAWSVTVFTQMSERVYSNNKCIENVYYYGYWTLKHRATKQCPQRITNLGLPELTRAVCHADVGVSKYCISDWVNLWIFTYSVWLRRILALLSSQHYLARDLNTIVLDYLYPCVFHMTGYE
jgi:hypothetical protein